MSQARKMLKIVSFVQVVVALAAVILGIVFFASGDAEPPFGLELATFRILVLLTLLAMGVFSFLAAAQGIKGANVPSKLGAHPQLNTACIATVVVDFILFFGVPAPNVGIIGLFALLAASYAMSRGNLVRKELDR